MSVIHGEQIEATGMKAFNGFCGIANLFCQQNIETASHLCKACDRRRRRLSPFEPVSSQCDQLMHDHLHDRQLVSENNASRLSGFKHQSHKGESTAARAPLAWPPAGMSKGAKLAPHDAEVLICKGAPKFEGFLHQTHYKSYRYAQFYAFAAAEDAEGSW